MGCKIYKSTYFHKPTIASLPNYSQKVCTFNTNNEILGDLSLCASGDSNNLFLNELKNRFNKRLGFEHIYITPEYGTMIGAQIRVLPDYRQKSFKIGEQLRLASIIDMQENNIDNFGIHSVNSAIYFHSKYKFIPWIKRFEHKISALNSIINNTTPETQEFAQSAQKLIKELSNETPFTEQSKLNEKINNLLKTYITRIMSSPDPNNYKKYPFSFGMDMVLTRENVFLNKDFFNALFAKHGIDYKI